MTEALFYHLDGQTLEGLLPQLLQRSLDRGWKVVVQVGSDERLAALDSLLWTYDEAAFLPHGTREDGHASLQPIFLSTDAIECPNGADVRFLVDRARPDGDLGRYQRLIIVFDGADLDALADARLDWKALKAGGLDCTYWQQVNGKWTRKA